MNIAQLILVGIFVGLAGGMFGIGGGIVLIPALTELVGPDQHRYQAAAMIVNAFVGISAVVGHRRADAIDTADIKKFLPIAAVAAVAGVGISELNVFAGRGEAYLRGLFGLFLFLCGVIEGYRLLRPGSQDNPSKEPITRVRLTWRLTVLVAVPTGLVAGLLGVGGGIVAVPLQRRFLRMPMRNAIANSAAIIIATSFIGAIVKNYAYAVENEDPIGAIALAAIVVPTAVVGSLIGSRLTHRLPIRALKGLFVVLLMIAAARFTHGAVQSLPKASSEPIAVARSAEAFISNLSSLRFGPTHPNRWYSSPTTVRPAAA